MINDYQKLSFFNPSCGELNFDGVIKEVFNYILSGPEEFYEIIVGCDSPSNERPTFPVVLVVLKKGQGGRFFLTKIRYPRTSQKRFFTFRQRVLEEIYLSCEIALKFRDIINAQIKEYKVPLNYQFQYIHADVGQNGPTKDMIKEVVGLIKSNGFEAKIKPESFAASTIADRFT